MFNIANSANYLFNVRIQKHTHTYCIVHWKCRLGASKLLLLLKLTCFLGTGSQTVPADSCTDMFRLEAHLYMRVTVLSVVSQALPCKHQKCFLFYKVCYILVSLFGVCIASIMTQKCLNQPDTFCYVCCELTFKYQRRNFTSLIKKCYELYFGYKYR
jgi:hypothetical protein